MYDWANSAYSTLSITVLVTYIRSVLLPGDAGTRAWAWGIGTSMVTAAVLSPVLGAMADARASKRKWLACCALGGATCATLLGLLPPTYPWLIVGVFFLTSLLFELSFGFYNAFLPELADEKTMNRVSALGYALGYIGGGLALLLVIGLIFRAGDFFGLATLESQLRAGLVLMGGWWGLFTLPVVLLVRDRSSPRNSSTRLGSIAAQSFREVRTTIANVGRYSVLATFLLGYLIYNEGVQTVLSQASVFAESILKMKASELALVVLMIQFAALPGALGVGWLADHIGQKRTLMICLATWAAVLVGAYFVETKLQFWWLGGILALVLGGTQSVSRSIMGTLTPPEKTAEFFGFFNLSSKATSMVGPILFAEVLVHTGDAHVAILSLLAFILVGWGIVATISVDRGRQQSRTAG